MTTTIATEHAPAATATPHDYTMTTLRMEQLTDAILDTKNTIKNWKRAAMLRVYPAAQAEARAMQAAAEETFAILLAEFSLLRGKSLPQ